MNLMLAFATHFGALSQAVELPEESRRQISIIA
jgi:hypothetical protein